MKNKNIIRFSNLSLVLLLSNITIYPKLASAQESSSNNRKNNNLNIPTIILIDNSGSMGKCSKKDSETICTDIKPYKIDEVKEAIRIQLKQKNISSDRIGITEFGNVKYFPEKNWCKSTRDVLPIGNHSQSDINSSLDEIKPNDNGTSPINYAVNRAIQSLQNNNLKPSRIVLFSDGEPNCGDDSENYLKSLCQTIRSSYQSEDKIDFKLHIIGYKANKDRQFRDCANELPKIVDYKTPKNKDELTKVVAKTFPHETDFKDNLPLLQIVLGCLASIASLAGIYFTYFRITYEKFTFLIQDELTHIAIKGAKILIIDNDHCSKNTDDNGIGIFNLKKSTKEIRVTVSKNGYKQIDQLIIPSNYDGSMDLKLSPVIVINPS